MIDGTWFPVITYVFIQLWYDETHANIYHKFTIIFMTSTHTCKHLAVNEYLVLLGILAMKFGINLQVCYTVILGERETMLCKWFQQTKLCKWFQHANYNFREFRNWRQEYNFRRFLTNYNSRRQVLFCNDVDSAARTTSPWQALVLLWRYVRTALLEFIHVDGYTMSERNNRMKV